MRGQATCVNCRTAWSARCCWSRARRSSPATSNCPAGVAEANRPVAPTDPWESFDWSGGLSEVSRRALGEVERRKIRQVLDEDPR